jgi:uncharacterized paraquat-inducible protein A
MSNNNIVYAAPEFMRKWTPWYRQQRIKQAAEEANKICKECVFTPKPEPKGCEDCSLTLKVLVCQENGKDFERGF